MNNSKFYFNICKGLFFVSFLLISLNSNAQIMRGTSVISGELYARYHTSEVTDGTEKHFDFYITPSFGYFLADNFSLNVALNGGYKTTTTPYISGENKDVTLSYSFEPSVKFYKSVTEKFYFDLQIFFLYGLSDNKYTPAMGTETKTSYADIAMGFRPGLTYFVTDKIAFTSTFGNIGYSIAKNKTKDTKSGTFVTRFGFNYLTFGLSFYLPRTI